MKWAPSFHCKQGPAGLLAGGGRQFADKTRDLPDKRSEFSRELLSVLLRSVEHWSQH